MVSDFFFFVHRSKQPKKALSSKRRLDLVQEAQAPSPSSSSSSSGCYTSDGVESESSEDEEGVLGEVMEDEGALWEEEGVAVKGRGRGKEGSGKFVQRKVGTQILGSYGFLKVYNLSYYTCAM